jgi:RNA ligase (TIGR02306 family)
VAKKAEFKINDTCVYFEVDSFLPIDERYEFLRRTSYRSNEFMGEGFRVKTMSMRGEISQGLALPVSLFPELDGFYPGDDVTDKLGVKKWEIPEVQGSAGIDIGDKPFGIPTTDETRIQSMPEFLDNFIGLPYYITTKMDGTSCTVYCKDSKVGVCGRNKEYKEDPVSCSMWAYVIKSGLKDNLLRLGADIALQGEFCGHGIQKNRLNLSEPELYIFDVMLFDDSGKASKCGLDDLVSFCAKLKIPTVPIEESGESFAYSLAELLEKARGQYASSKEKEGIVVRTRDYGRALVNGVSHKLSFKVLNNDFLQKEK